MLIAVSVTELVRILSSVDRDFAEVEDLAPSLPGLIQRLDEIIKIQFDTREQGEVSEFDFIGSTGVFPCADGRNGAMELHNCSPQKGGKLAGICARTT